MNAGGIMKMAPFDYYSKKEKEYIRCLTIEEIRKMSYVKFISLIKEINKPPGGLSYLLKMIRILGINENSLVLDVGCNTGYITFETVHFTKCKIIGIDIDEDMIRTANNIKKFDSFRNLITFKIADARKLPFSSNFFNYVVIGGSLAFINNKIKALREFLRVLKPWGLIGDLEFFYKKKPSQTLLDKLKKVLEVEIKPWNYDFWLELYKKAGFEIIYHEKMKLKMYRSRKTIKEYCKRMIDRVPFNKKVKKVAFKKLFEYMLLFNENNRLLDGIMIIGRKREYSEQIFLFSK